MSLAEVLELGSEQRGYWSEERKLIRDTARSFAIEEVLPVANKLDPEKGEIPQSLVDKMGDLGFFGITIPEDLGGLGLGCFEYCVVAEQLARGWMSVASIMARGNSFYTSIPAPNDDEKRKKMPFYGKG